VNPSVSVSTPAVTATTAATTGGATSTGGGSAGGAGGGTGTEGSGAVSTAQVAQICARSAGDGSCTSTRFVALRDGTVAQPAAQVQLSENQLLW
jgi:hypothetical protein